MYVTVGGHGGELMELQTGSNLWAEFFKAFQFTLEVQALSGQAPL